MSAHTVPPRTPRAVPRIPWAPTDPFIGRRRELDAVTAALEHGERLVTLVGTAGIGKTRLATELAAAAASAGTYAGGIWFCDLTEARDAGDVCRVVAEALGLPLGGATAAQLGRALAGRGDALVVLDNFEQIVAHASATVARWLELAPEARFLVTSREALRVRSEYAVELPPLALVAPGGAPASAEAVQLFVERARRRGCALGPDDLPVVVEIAEQLDGLPLALELAAARLNALDPRTLLARLTQRFALLSHGLRTATARQATLRGSLDWSWQLLEPHERDALAQCAAFRGGFTLAAAEGVLDLSAHAGAPAVLDVVQSLRDKSLLRAPTARTAAAPARFALFASVREYAAERAREAGLTEAAAARHAGYFAAAAARWAEQAAARGATVEDVITERENVLVAAAHALAAAGPDDVARALHLLLALDPTYTPGLTMHAYLPLLDAALAAAARGVDPVLRARALAARGNARRLVGDMAGARRDLAEADAAAQAAGDSLLVAHVALRTGNFHLSKGEHAAALAALVRARELYGAHRQRTAEGITLAVLGAVYLSAGALDQGRVHLAQAVAIHRAEGEHALEARALNNLGYCHLDLGAGDTARACFDRALALQSDATVSLAVISAVAGLAAVSHDAGELDGAWALYERALRTAGMFGDPRWEGAILGPLGEICLEQGRLDDAVAFLERALTIVTEMGDAHNVGVFGAHLAAVHALAGRVGAAEQLIAAAPAAAADELAGVLGARALARVALDVARARGVDAAGDAAGAAAHRAAARAHLAAVTQPRPADATQPHGAPPAGVVCHEARVAARIARRLLGDAPDATAAVRAPDPGAPALVLRRDGRWFEPPSGARVDCHRRQALRLLLLELVRQSVHAPGVPLSARALVDAAWPGERLQWAAARNRLHVSLTTLRDLGLRDCLRATEDGYLLDPALAVRFVD